MNEWQTRPNEIFPQNQWVRMNDLTYQWSGKGEIVSREQIKKKTFQYMAFADTSDMVRGMLGENVLASLIDKDGCMFYSISGCDDVVGKCSIFYEIGEMGRAQLQNGVCIHANLKNQDGMGYIDGLYVPLMDEAGALELIFAVGLYNKTATEMMECMVYMLANNFRVQAGRNQKLLQYVQSIIDEVPEGVVFLNPFDQIVMLNKSAMLSLYPTGGAASEVYYTPLKITPVKDNFARVSTRERSIFVNTLTQFPLKELRNLGFGEKILIFKEMRNQYVMRSISAPPPEDAFRTVAGRSGRMKSVIALAKKAAGKNITVLLQGESGTGKEVLANAIHKASGRTGAFVPVNCGAIPKELIQSELFGYEEGSFTGARRGGKKGKILLADEGTLFLDEIGEMPLDMQTSLLRFLEDKVVTPLGGSTGQKANVRIVAATNRDLLGMVEEGTFRKDLYYRLNVFNILMPTLRERKEDIPVLAEYLLHTICEESKSSVPMFSQDAIERMTDYPWPGNVRELRNAVEYALCVCDGSVIVPEDLPQTLKAQPEKPRKEKREPESMKDCENRAIEEALKQYGGNISKAAKHLGISRTTLYKKLEQMYTAT